MPIDSREWYKEEYRRKHRKLNWRWKLLIGTIVVGTVVYLLIRLAS